ncbi:TetR/AcrR family transcriptional regulator [Rhizobium mongolense]|uniref:TetR family transcriptional regulator protein n=1 Tax=Rhizobium gallicum TaxID=56730 RepID=A0A1L5NU72_9HYPH|nr:MULTISPECIES: TetR/AcrR family transcriptional regulator [Rhizobium]APO71442.1 TetR family transcriptional regulator protein [Rhizobium gallicum]QPB23300.1 TetR/AcrR family transcriptional regulator [Rhizobium sp. 007]WFU91626.1 TetR/AcrR family transcriptional regulator [Rhizobium sp. CC1099]
MSRTSSAKKSETSHEIPNVLTNEKIPPRERIVSTASELFREHGIRGIGVDAIADAALTNKMTLYRHFGSKDELVCETLRRASEKAEAIWRDLEATHPGNPRAQLDAWVQGRAECLNGEPAGCDLANAAIELKGEGHPAHEVIERHKAEQRQRLEELCSAAGAREPQLLADTLTLLLEGARVTRQAMGSDGCCSHFSKACSAAIASLC